MRPDLWITLADPHRASHELSYHPGEANFRSAGVILISKADTAPEGSVSRIRESAARLNRRAKVLVALRERQIHPVEQRTFWAAFRGTRR